MFNSPYKVNKSVGLKQFRKRKPVVKTRGFWIVVLSVIGIGGMGYFLLFSGVFSIKDIKISDVEGVSKDELNSLVKDGLASQMSFLNRNNILFASVKNIESKILDTYAVLENVKIKKQLFSALIVGVVKREPKLLWCYQEGQKCFLADKNCLLYQEKELSSFSKELSSFDGVAIVFSAGEPKKILEKACFENEISQILKIQAMLNDIGVGIEKFVPADEDILTVKTKEGWQIYFDESGNTDLCLKRLKLLLEQELTQSKRANLEYINLRFSKVYYK